MSARNFAANKTKIWGIKQMQASSTEVQSAIQKAVQAFRDMKYPVTKNQLIEKAKSLNARSEVMQAIENIPDKEYHSAPDVLKEFEGVQKAVQAFHDMKYPASRTQLLAEAKKLNARKEIITALEACPDKQYNSAVDVIRECKGKFQSK
jgi:cellobiose-specific phosphotransferase system component IIA